MAQSIQSIQAMHELNAEVYNRKNWALGINSSLTSPKTVADLENLKNGRPIGYSNYGKKGGPSYTVRKAEYRLEEAKTYLGILEGRKTDGINRLKRNKYDKFDLNEFNKSPDYTRAVKEYKTAKDELMKQKRNEKEEAAKYKLAYQRAEMDGTANRDRKSTRLNSSH